MPPETRDFNPWRFSVAPMMDWTDRHDRFFLRLISRRARLYTEMLTTGAIRFGDRRRLLAYDPAEQPLGLQVGGSQPAELAECARIAESLGYSEVNLNCGCPSERVQAGRFGARLMAEPDLVARSVAAMAAAVAIPVTIKSRIAIDDLEPWPTLSGFVARIADAGCRTFIVHARKAWLDGLSPKENRDVPPLDYAMVHRLKAECPGLTIVINGGLANLDAAEGQLRHVDGVMLGRAAYGNPYLLAEVDRRFFADPTTPPSRHQVIERLIPYVERERRLGTPLKHIARHLLGLFQGRPGARLFRRHLAENAHLSDAGVEVVRQAAELAAPDDIAMINHGFRSVA
ncbi:MAG: tRNA dihydrouridine(20/20a) synthase DusA [Alphaproteobacteria bacterium]|nr:tRNA dihydrouridine(20/20a) synthase DusA [Alphaproteobacteria bacterium]